MFEDLHPSSELHIQEREETGVSATGFPKRGRERKQCEGRTKGKSLRKSVPG